MARLGTFDELLTDVEPGIAEVARALRALIVELDPAAVEVVRLGDRAATYGLGPRKMIDGYCYLIPQRDWVNLGFYQGGSLPDPAALLDGTGAMMRHVKVRTVDDARSAAIRELLVAARAERVRTHRG